MLRYVRPNPLSSCHDHAPGACDLTESPSSERLLEVARTKGEIVILDRLRPQLRTTALPIFFVLLSLAPAGARAKAIHLDLPPELRSRTDDLPVTDRKRLILPKRATDRAVVFGSFRVDQYRAGWTEKTRYGISSRSLAAYTEKSWRRYSFELRTSEGANLAVECVQRKEERGVSLSEENGKTDFDVPWGEELRCSLYPGDGVVWELVVAGGRGTLTGPDNASFEIRASNRAEGTSFRIPTPVGFLFHQGDKTVGAVEVLNKGRFLLAQDLTPSARNLVAAASSALLLADSMH
jgi:hypothetical protein